MTIKVSQPDNRYAAPVEIYVQGVMIGKINGRESVSTEIPYTDQCVVEAECGYYWKRMVVGGDADIWVKWVPERSAMELERKRNLK